MSECVLIVIAGDVWEGFTVFDLSPRQSLVKWLGPIADRLLDAPFGDYLYTCRRVHTLHANWKLGLEAASEGYHVQVLHKNTARRMLVYPGNPHVHYADFQALGAHRNMATDLSPEFTFAEQMTVQTFAFTHAPGMVVQSRDAAEECRAGEHTYVLQSLLGHPSGVV